MSTTRQLFEAMNASNMILIDGIEPDRSEWDPDKETMTFFSDGCCDPWRFKDQTVEIAEGLATAVSVDGESVNIEFWVLKPMGEP